MALPQFFMFCFFSIQEKLSWKTGEGGPFKMLYKEQWATAAVKATTFRIIMLYSYKSMPCKCGRELQLIA